MIRLKVYYLVENKVPGDGNCQVGALFILKINGSAKKLASRILLPSVIFSSYVSLIHVFLQFRSLSDQLYDSPEHHKSVREQVIEQVGLCFNKCASMYLY